MSKYTDAIAEVEQMKQRRYFSMEKAQEDYDNMRHSDPEIVRKAEDRYLLALLAVIAHELMLKR